MITTVSTSGGAQVAVFALPTRTMYSGLRVSWLSYLGAAEQRRAAELPTPVGAVSYLSTQALMRSMAAYRLGVASSAAHTIEVDRTCTLCNSTKPHGKPRIEGMNFNMSQVSSLAVGGFCPDDAQVLGVDLEPRRDRLFPGFARVALSLREREIYETTTGEARNLLGVALWTAKEAVLKATGHGLSVSPAAVRVFFSDSLTDQLAKAFEASRELADEEVTAASVCSARAVFTVPSRDNSDTTEERSFHITWTALTLHPEKQPAHNNPQSTNPAHGSDVAAEQFLLATATEGVPNSVHVHPVATPVELRNNLAPLTFSQLPAMRMGTDTVTA